MPHSAHGEGEGSLRVKDILGRATGSRTQRLIVPNDACCRYTMARSAFLYCQIFGQNARLNLKLMHGRISNFRNFMAFEHEVDEPDNAGMRYDQGYLLRIRMFYFFKKSKKSVFYILH